MSTVKTVDRTIVRCRYMKSCSDNDLVREERATKVTDHCRNSGHFFSFSHCWKKIMCLLSKKVTSDFFSKLKYIFFRLISLFHLYTFFFSFCEFKSRIYIHILKEDIFSIYKNKPLEGFKLFPIFLLAKSMPSIWFQFAKIFAVKLHFSVQVPLPGLLLQSASPALAALAWSVEGRSARAMQHPEMCSSLVVLSKPHVPAAGLTDAPVQLEFCPVHNQSVFLASSTCGANSFLTGKQDVPRSSVLLS